VILRIARGINANAELCWLAPVSIAEIDRAIWSFEDDGYTFEYVVDREEMIARRIRRLGPGTLADGSL